MQTQNFKFTSLLPVALYGIAALSFAPTNRAFAATAPPATGVLLDTKADAEFKSEGATASFVDENGGKTLKATFPGGGGYPAFAFPTPDDGWDLSKYSGVQVDVTNAGTGNVKVALRVDNAGDWKKNPFNTEAVTVKAGETKTIKVTFGKSYGGNPGFALDSSKVSAIKIFAENPKQESTVTVSNLKTFGTATLVPLNATPAALPTGGAATGGAATGGATPGAKTGMLFESATLDADAFKTQGDAEVSIVEAGGAKVVQGQFPEDDGYPAFDFPMPTGPLNLSSSAGVQAEITNTGTTSLRLAMRVDNAGDWKKEPFNTESTNIKAGETKTLKVTFGQSHGNPGFALDASKITVIKIFAISPKKGGTVQVKSLQTFGTRGANATAAAAATTPTATTVATTPKAGAINTNQPPITGELLVLNDKFDLASLKPNQTAPTLTTDGGQPALKVEFLAGDQQYPNLQFPVPQGGWNLSTFGGIEAEITNPGTSGVTVLMRADNPGKWQDNPWNTQKLTIGAGETKKMQLIFGQDNGAPSFPLDANRVVGIQMFMIKPKAGATIVVKNLKGFGSPQAGASALSSPADRLKPIVPAAWVGQRPPVEGQWVQTLNENFDAKTLNDKLWNPRTWWNSLIPGQTQRYSTDNLIFENGLLKMKVEKRRGHQYDDPTLPEMDYTTGHIVTYDKWAQKYGYFEARIKLPTARGIWPAFWMMPDRGPAAGAEGWKRESTSKGGMEIDILEHLTEWGPGRSNVALHWDGYGKEHQAWGTSNIYYGPTPDGFHTFGVLWEPGKLTWFIDGIKKAEYESPRVSSVPAYMLLNVQMGAWATKDVDLAKLPDYYQIDWVRVWQTKDQVKGGPPGQQPALVPVATK